MSSVLSTFCANNIFISSTSELPEIKKSILNCKMKRSDIMETSYCCFKSSNVKNEDLKADTGENNQLSNLSLHTKQPPLITISEKEDLYYPSRNLTSTRSTHCFNLLEPIIEEDEMVLPDSSISENNMDELDEEMDWNKFFERKYIDGQQFGQLGFARNKELDNEAVQIILKNASSTNNQTIDHTQNPKNYSYSEIFSDVTNFASNNPLSSVSSPDISTYCLCESCQKEFVRLKQNLGLE